MALQNVDQQALDYIGEAVAGDIGLSTNMLNDWGNAGIRTIINRVPTHILGAFTKDSTDQTSNGYSAAVNKVHRVVRENGTNDAYVECRKTDANNIFEVSKIATADDPYWYEDIGKIYVLPTPGASPNAFKVFEADIGTRDLSISPSISNFPDELVNAVIFYMVSQAKYREMGVMSRDAQTEVEVITDTGILDNIPYTAIGNAITGADDRLVEILTETTGSLDMANAEFDKIYEEIDTASTTISSADEEDVTRGTAELRVASSRAENGVSYLGEARSRMNAASTYLSEATAEAGKANIYLQEAQTRLGTANSYLQQAARANNEAITFENKFDKEVANYIGGGDDDA